ncbi:MAG: hypothetical protein AB7O80_16430 [Acetobacteraceae bacterium]
MESPDELILPSAADEERQAPPMLRAAAELIGALGANGGFMPPRRLDLVQEVADSVGSALGNPSLLRVLALRALSAPPAPRSAISAMRAASGGIAAPQRADMMREFARLLVDAKPGIAELGAEIASALGVPLPEALKRGSLSLREAGGSLVERARRLVRSEDPLLVEARGFAVDFVQPAILAAVRTAQKTGDVQPVLQALPVALEAVTHEIGTLTRITASLVEAEREAAELDKAAETMKRVADQRFAAITRRAKMLKRHLQEDLDALVEDGVEEFEVDFRRLAEGKKWFNRSDSGDMNERVVVKNLERRYRNLARRYQDHLDLLDREVSEFCDEFTRVGDDAIKPLARHEFRTVVAHPSLRLRAKVAADRASTGTLAAGTAAAAAGGVAMQTGLLTTAAVAGAAVTPVGAVVLGAVALASVWKMASSPSERRRRDARDRARELEDSLRETIAANYPRFCEAVDQITARFQAAAIPDISRPRIEADRVREIATARRVIAQGVADAAQARVDTMLGFLRAGAEAVNSR